MYHHLLTYCHGGYGCQDKMKATKCRVARMYILCVQGRWWCVCLASLDLQTCLYVYQQTYTSPHKVFTMPTTTVLDHYMVIHAIHLIHQ